MTVATAEPAHEKHMDLPTLVLSPRYTTDSISLSKAASDAGWDIERLVQWRAPDRLKDKYVAIYGEPFFAAAIAEQLAVALIEPSFNWLTALPPQYTGRRVWFGTPQDALRSAEPTFIKPADDKSFPAQVYGSGSELPNLEHLPEDTPVLLSEPVTWEVEYRGFIRDRQLLTLSPYFRGGTLAQAEDGSWPAEPEETEEATECYAALLGDDMVALPPAVVIDVGRIAGRGWAVVEANPAWSSGIYGCDPAQVLRVVEKTCIRQGFVTDDDRAWIISRNDATRQGTPL